MLRQRARESVVAVLVAFSLLAAGCGTAKPDQEPKAAPQPSLGIVDIQKVLQAHPQYGQVLRLQKEYNTLAAVMEAARDQAGRGPGTGQPGIDGAGLQDAASQEFDARMRAKEREINAQLGEEAGRVQKELEVELEAYVHELDKEYQPQIFSLQLKLKTLQLSKEEAAALQAELEKLQAERNTAINARHQELAGKLEERMAGKQADARKEMEAYAREVNTDLAGKLAARQSALPGGAVPPPAESDQQEQQLAAKRQEISALQDSMITEIREKVAKVAAEKNLEAVFGDAAVNVKAVDITDAVIAEFKR